MPSGSAAAWPPNPFEPHGRKGRCELRSNTAVLTVPLVGPCGCVAAEADHGEGDQRFGCFNAEGDSGHETDLDVGEFDAGVGEEVPDGTRWRDLARLLGHTREVTVDERGVIALASSSRQVSDGHAGR